jgi:hypothetical protein
MSPKAATAQHIEVNTGSDAFILTSTDQEKQLEVPDHAGQEFRLTITIAWEEYRDPSQTAGTLWLEYLLGKTTPALPGIEAVVPIAIPRSENKTFLVVTRGNVRIHYTGEAKAHVWLSHYGEYAA